MATANPLLATPDKLLLYSTISVPSEYTSLIDLSVAAKVGPVPEVVFTVTVKAPLVAFSII